MTRSGVPWDDERRRKIDWFIREAGLLDWQRLDSKSNHWVQDTAPAVMKALAKVEVKGWAELKEELNRRLLLRKAVEERLISAPLEKLRVTPWEVRQVGRALLLGVSQRELVEWLESIESIKGLKSHSNVTAIVKRLFEDNRALLRVQLREAEFLTGVYNLGSGNLVKFGEFVHARAEKLLAEAVQEEAAFARPTLLEVLGFPSQFSWYVARLVGEKAVRRWEKRDRGELISSLMALKMLFPDDKRLGQAVDRLAERRGWERMQTWRFLRALFLAYPEELARVLQDV